MKTNPNDQAYPLEDTMDYRGRRGLTKFEYFTVHILAGMHASTPGCVSESCVSFALKEAKILIEALNKETK